ncbi:MAG: radical SAM family heme chaperone HemW [Pseudomonadales bacterium]|nr:radical SAM family heme chaperone HemW [Pseudomonadales bacterium]
MNGHEPSRGDKQLELPPLSLYIHIPWCIRKCPYCDFNSHQKKGELPEQDYIRALLQDLHQDLPYLQGRTIQSVFFGGGTPSLFSASAIAQLLTQLNNRVALEASAEITLEANPGTAERQRFADYKAAGITRLSLGIQSFDDESLQQLGRIHGSNDGRRAIEFAHAAGFAHLNIDIMYGLQQQTPTAAIADLEQAIAAGSDHLSWYQLTIEPNTEFFKNPPRLPEESLLMDIQEAGLALLARQGFQRYEISAYARPGNESRHNLNYWLFGDYIGIGAGAHGKITVPAKDWVLRTRKLKQPTHYMSGTDNRTAATTAVPVEELAVEFMLNSLRLTQGFLINDFEQRTGLAFDTIEKQVESLQAKKLLDRSGNRILPTAKGLEFLNDVLAEFLQTRASEPGHD